MNSEKKKKKKKKKSFSYVTRLTPLRKVRDHLRPQL